MSPANRPLERRAIVVTRPGKQAGGLVDAIQAAGGRALRYPALEIEAVRNSKLDAAIGSLSHSDLSIFISRNAVEQGLPRVRELGAVLSKVAAVGGATRRALESAGEREVLAPEGPADSEALLALQPLKDVAGKRVVIFRGEGGRELLAESLRSRGATVVYAECYRRIVPTIDVTALLAGWSAGEVDAVTVSSAEGLANFVWLVGEPGRRLLRTTPLFLPHARVRSDAEALGAGKVVVAGASDEEMLGALVAYFGRAG